MLQGNSPKWPRGSFSFSENPPAESCHSIQGRACPLTQPTFLARLGTVWVRAPHGPTLNCPQPVPTVSLRLPLCPYSPPCDFKQSCLSGCCSNLVWQGREPCSRSGPCAGARDLFVLKQSPYCLFFQCPLYFLVSCFHKRWDTVDCLLLSSVEQLGVSPLCTGKWTLLPPMSPSSSLLLLRFYI